MAFTNLLEVVYPVGSVYVTTSSVSPAEVVGGTWEKIEGLNLGIATKLLFGGQYGFNVTQTGNFVLATGMLRYTTLSGWEESCVLSLDSNFPQAFGGVGGAFYAQNGGKDVFMYPGNGEGNKKNLYISNKNSNSTPENWYFGSMPYITTQDDAITNDLGVKMWKRIS